MCAFFIQETMDIDRNIILLLNQLKINSNELWVGVREIPGTFSILNPMKSLKNNDQQFFTFITFFVPKITELFTSCVCIFF